MNSSAFVCALGYTFGLVGHRRAFNDVKLSAYSQSTDYFVEGL